MAIQATRLETEDDVRQALNAFRPGAVAKAPAKGGQAPADDAPPIFRPSLRPSTPVLTICDDGLETGETIRIRTNPFVIGRTEGDLKVPHDGQMSSRHAALKLSTVKDKPRWTLVDLKSTNGTYVRVAHAVLEDGSEFVVGRTRLRFENKSLAGAAQSRKTAAAEQTTQLWQQPDANHSAPALIELAGDGTGRRALISKHETWLGKDPSHCQMVLPADPYVSARHARIRYDDEGRWVLENNKSVNGVWLKVEQIAFKDSCRFMLGEQLFLVQVP